MRYALVFMVKHPGGYIVRPDFHNFFLKLYHFHNEEAYFHGYSASHDWTIINIISDNPISTYERILDDPKLDSGISDMRVCYIDLLGGRWGEIIQSGRPIMIYPRDEYLGENDAQTIRGMVHSLIHYVR